MRCYANTSKTWGCRTPRVGRCHTPLIEICDSTTQIKLDLNSCHPCSAKPTALLLRKGGCTEYEEIYEEVKSECCGVIDNRYTSKWIKRVIPKLKPSITYPLHEIDPDGMSVFSLDDKFKLLGYGRFLAVVLVDNIETNLVFDVNYIPSFAGISRITTERIQPNLGEC